MAVELHAVGNSAPSCQSTSMIAPTARAQIGLRVGDPMPRIMLREVGGSVFDSWHQANAGRTQVYWIDPSLVGSVAEDLAAKLAACDAELHLVVSASPLPPHVSVTGLSQLVDPTGELRSAAGAAGPVGVVVDASGRLAAIMPTPVLDGVVALARTLYAASVPTVVLNQAPVLMLDRVLEPMLCTALVNHWQQGNKLVDGVASIVGANRADADIKRRADVPLDDTQLFVLVRDCLVRRLIPAILQAFHSRIVQIEMPRIGCYDVSSGGWFRRHRDNTTPYTAHRQFALSLNLNADTEYDGGQVRFPEFGRQLYRPAAGGAMVFSCSLLHEAMPVTRGRRFGLFTFLHDERHDAQYRRLIADQKARAGAGIRMRDERGV